VVIENYHYILITLYTVYADSMPAVCDKLPYTMHMSTKL